MARRLCTVDRVPGPDASTGRRPRRDALRNRNLILETARRLFEERGGSAISMEDIAATAGLAKGTVFHHFADRASLVAALVGDGEIEFQEHLLRGDPPLGPGAPAKERIVAFGQRRLDMLEQTSDILRDAEASRGLGRLLSPIRDSYYLHLGLLLADSSCPLDANLAADALIEMLSAQLFFFERHERGRSLEALQANWKQTIELLCP